MPSGIGLILPVGIRSMSDQVRIPTQPGKRFQLLQVLAVEGATLAV